MSYSFKLINQLKNIFGGDMITTLKQCLNSFTLLTIFFSTSLFSQTFTKITNSPVTTDSGRTLGISFVDFDGDGDIDIYSNDLSFPTNDEDKLFRNMLVETGDAKFERVTEAGDLLNIQTGTLGSTWTDADNDGDLDVLLGGFQSRFFMNNGDGTFDLINEGDIEWEQDRKAAWSVSSADWTGDGYTDLLYVHAAGFIGGGAQPNHMFINNGDGTFFEVDSGASDVTTNWAPYTCANWADYDRDGDIDLFIGSGPANGTVAPDFIYKNMLVETGTATLERLSGDAFIDKDRDGQVYNFIDYDNDGDLDMCVTNYWGGQGTGLANELWRNDNGQYVEITEGSLVTDPGFSLANVWGDFDNDGDVDVFISNDGGSVNRFYTNNGDGTFTALTGDVFDNESAATGSYGTSAGDYDNDGDLDLVVGNAAFVAYPGDVNFLYRNDTDDDNNWVNIKCEGTQTNRAATGTEVYAKANINGVDTWQYRFISSSDSFNGQNDLRVHFGFGDAEEIDTLRIEWLSGNIDVYTDIEVNEFYKAVEGGDLDEYDDDDADDEEDDEDESQQEFSVEQNFPNPFNPSTTIKYDVPEASFVSIIVYDVLGNEIKSLVSETKNAGSYSINFDASSLSSGIYYYILRAGSSVVTNKMLLLK